MLDHTLQYAVGGRGSGCIRGGAGRVAIAEDVDIRALKPIGIERSVQSLLDVGTVEID